MKTVHTQKEKKKPTEKSRKSPVPMLLNVKKGQAERTQEISTRIDTK